MNQESKNLVENLLVVADFIARHSGGRITLIFTRNSHSLLLDGERMGMIIEDYPLVSGGNMGDKRIFLKFFEDFFLPLRKYGFLESFKVAGLHLKIIGLETFKRSQEWGDLFKPEIPA